MKVFRSEVLMLQYLGFQRKTKGMEMVFLGEMLDGEQFESMRKREGKREGGRDRRRDRRRERG